MRKEESNVTLRREELDVVFDCSDRDKAFVRTAVLEVVSDLRRMAAELAKPIDRSTFTQTSGRDGCLSTSALCLASHVDPCVLEPNLSGTCKEELIDELIQLAAHSGLIRGIDEARAAVIAREATGSTGMQHGIALPHGKTVAVEQIVCAIGLKKEGVDFDSLDGEPSRIFVLVLSPKDVSGPHIRFLSTISQVMDENGRRSLLECRTSEEMYAFLASTGKPQNRTR